MLYKQLYEYNKPEAIICSHHWAAPHLLPATLAQQLLTCCSSSPTVVCFWVFFSHSGALKAANLQQCMGTAGVVRVIGEGVPEVRRGASGISASPLRDPGLWGRQASVV